ncbi:MAG: UbiA prenyltransferase family protein [Bacilli bacterium]
MKKYIKLIRPKHYLKNILIFLPLLFSGKLLEFEQLKLTVIAFISFSFMASVVYIINDIRDKEKDKLHIKKKLRPIASGDVSVTKAVILALMLFVASISISLINFPDVTIYSYMACLILYLLLNVGYSFGLKNVPLMDVTILVSGFFLRVFYGALVINVNISNWLYLTVIAISFYMSLGKRRNEIIKQGTNSREVLKYYNLSFLDKNMYMCLAITIVFYSLWCVDPTTVLKTGQAIIWTVPLVILICMKYSMNIEGNSLGDPIDVIFADKVLMTLVLIYGIIIVLLLYLPKLSGILL